MAGPGGKEIGRLSIRVTADTTGMMEKIKRDVERADKKDAPIIPVEADTDRFVAAVIAAKQAVSDRPVRIDIDAGISRADVDLTQVEADIIDALDGVDGGEVEVDVVMDRKAEAKLKTLIGQLVRRINATQPTLNVETQLDQRVFQQQTNAFRRSLETTRPFELDANIRLSENAIEALHDQWDVVTSQTAEQFGKALGREIDEVEYDVLLDRLEAEIDRKIKRHEAQIRLTLDKKSLVDADREIKSFLDDVDSYWDAFDRDTEKLVIQRRVQEALVAEAKASDERYLDALERRTRRLGLWTDVFREKLAIVGGATLISGLTAAVSLLTAYLAAGAGQAVALAAGLSQVLGGMIMLPGLLVGGAAALGVVILGMQGFSTAVKTLMNGDATPEELAEALEGLSPAAQSAAKAVAGLRPAFGELKRGIQESLFVGLDGAIDRLSAFAVAMRPSLMSIATGWNAVFSQALGGLTQESSVAGFSTTFQNFGKMMTAFSVGIPAGIRGMAALSAAASNFFEMFGEWGADKLQNFEGWVARITSDGSFDRWVNNARIALGDLSASFGNVADGLAGIFNVSGSAVLLGQIRDITASFDDWANSVSGSNAIQNFFDTTRMMIVDVHSVAKQLGPVFSGLWDGIGGFIRNFSSAFPNAMKGAGQAAQDFGDAVAGLGGPMAEILGAVVLELGSLAKDVGPGLADLGRSIAPFVKEVGEFASGAGGVFISALTATLEIANKLMEVFPGLAMVLGSLFAVNKITSLASNFNQALLSTFPAMTNFTQKAVLTDNGFRQLGVGAALATKSTLTFKDAAATAGRGLSNALPVAALAIGIYAAADALYSRLNPELVRFGELRGQLDGKFDAIFAQIETGAITAAGAIKMASDAFAELRAQQKAAADDIKSDGFGENFLESLFPMVEATERLTLQGLEGAGFMGQPIIDGALKLAFEALPAVTKATAEYTEAQKGAVAAAAEFGKGSPEHKAALDVLDAATRNLANAKRDEADATRTAADAALEMVQAQMTLAAMNGDAAAAQLNVNSAIDNYGAALDEFGEGSLEATAALGTLSSQMSIAVTAIGDAAYNQALATGATDAGSQAILAQVAYLDELIAAQGVHSAEAVVQKNALMNTAAQTWLSSDAFVALKDKIIAVPGEKSIEVSAETYQANKAIIDTNYYVQTMPDGSIRITAKDEATQIAKNAVAGIGQMVARITVTTKYVPKPHPVAGAGSFFGGKRDGGYISEGSHPRIDDVPTLLAKGEYVLHAGAVKALGREYLDSLNSIGKSGGARSASAITGKFADGGDTSDWFNRAMARVASNGNTLDLGTVSVSASAGAGNTFVLPEVDPHSLAREVDRINGFNATLTEVL